MAYLKFCLSAASLPYWKSIWALLESDPEDIRANPPKPRRDTAVLYGEAPPRRSRGPTHLTSETARNAPRKTEPRNAVSCRAKSTRGRPVCVLGTVVFLIGVESVRTGGPRFRRDGDGFDLARCGVVEAARRIRGRG